MWAPIISALGVFARWALGSVTIKWGFAAFLTFALTSMLTLLISFLPSWFSPDTLTGGTSAFTPGIWYFIDYFRIEFTIATLFSAYTARFLIRRIPFIG